jgi:hypothetical protein
MQYVDSSERDPRSDLHNAGIARAGNKAKRVGVNIPLGVPELSVIEQIECLESQLKIAALGDLCNLSQ